MELNLTAAEIAAIVGAEERRGQAAHAVRGIAALDAAEPGDLSFLGNPKYKAQVATTRASLVLVPRGYDQAPSDGQELLILENPSAGLARLCARLEQRLWPAPAAGVHSSAVVAPGAVVAPTASIGPLCVIEAGAVVGERAWLQSQVFVGQGARVGADCRLHGGVHIAPGCVLGERVRLHPGVVIGGDGFGYEFAGGRHEKVPQVGDVFIGDDVEIGANTTIDRARFSRTEVGEGTKIDNLVQIGHNVRIGRHCLICGQAGIAGSTTLEDYVVLGGQAGLAGHIRIGRGAKVGGQTGVPADVPPGATVFGRPALPYLLEQRLSVLRQRLPDLFRRVDLLEAELEKMASAAVTFQQHPPR